MKLPIGASYSASPMYSPCPAGAHSGERHRDTERQRTAGFFHRGLSGKEVFMEVLDGKERALTLWGKNFPGKGKCKGQCKDFGLFLTEAER